MGEKKSKENQIELIASYIMAEYPDFIDRSEGDGECAIRLIKNLKANSIPVDKVEALLNKYETDMDYYADEFIIDIQDLLPNTVKTVSVLKKDGE